MIHFPLIAVLVAMTPLEEPGPNPRVLVGLNSEKTWECTWPGGHDREVRRILFRFAPPGNADPTAVRWVSIDMDIQQGKNTWRARDMVRGLTVGDWDMQAACVDVAGQAGPLSPVTDETRITVVGDRPAAPRDVREEP